METSFILVQIRSCRPAHVDPTNVPLNHGHVNDRKEEGNTHDTAKEENKHGTGAATKVSEPLLGLNASASQFIARCAIRGECRQGQQHINMHSSSRLLLQLEPSEELRVHQQAAPSSNCSMLCANLNEQTKKTAKWFMFL